MFITIGKFTSYHSPPTAQALKESLRTIEKFTSFHSLPTLRTSKKLFSTPTLSSGGNLRRIIRSSPFGPLSLTLTPRLVSRCIHSLYHSLHLHLGAVQREVAAQGEAELTARPRPTSSSGGSSQACARARRGRVRRGWGGMYSIQAS